MNEATREYVRRFVAEAPPLSPAQRDLIRRICAATLVAPQPDTPAHPTKGASPRRVTSGSKSYRRPDERIERLLEEYDRITIRQQALVRELTLMVSEPPAMTPPPAAEPLNLSLNRWLTSAQAAERAGRHPGTILKAAEVGTLHGHQRKRRGRWQFAVEAVDAWMLGQDPFAACGCGDLPKLGGRQRR